MLGYDSYAPVTEDAAKAAVANGAGFWCRYYSYNPRKDLTLTEAQRIAAAGLKVVSVFENSDKIADFGGTQATQDADQALFLASICGQPAGGVIYFAVDFDAQKVVLPRLIEHFTELNRVVDFEAVVGVYGNGLVCQTLLDAGLVKKTWLCGGRGMAGYHDFLGKQDILQSSEQGIVVGGVSVDKNEAQGDFGGWEPTP